MKDTIIERMTNFMKLGSGWRSRSIVKLNWKRRQRYLQPFLQVPQENDFYEKSTFCHICGGELGDDRVRDHCHLTGKFRGAAHNKFNLKYQVPKFIPVVLHNLSNYDTHMFIKKLRGKISCKPNNEEKYISFSKIDEDEEKEIRFISFIHSFICS